MGDSRELLTHDLQASPSEVPLALSRAGVGGVQKAIRIRYGEHEKLIAAEIDCTVDLEAARKGVHMSRFPELFEEAIEEVVIGEALLVEELAEHIAAHIVERQKALRAEVRIAARYPLERETPVTGLRTQEMVSLIGLAAASSEQTRRLVGVEATGINACPCAQSGSARPGSTSSTSSGSSSSFLWRRTTSAGAGRSSWGPRRPSTRNSSSGSSKAR
jgi:GTP cyclohydrolase-4